MFNPFQMGDLYWFLYKDPSGKRSRGHNDYFLGRVKEKDEQTVSWTWLDNNSDATQNFHVAVAEGARAPSDREMESMHERVGVSVSEDVAEDRPRIPS